MKIEMKGTLEVDENRGVTYFHPDELMPYGQTALRIQGLAPFKITKRMLDVNLQSVGQNTALMAAELAVRMTEEGHNLEAILDKIRSLQ